MRGAARRLVPLALVMVSSLTACVGSQTDQSADASDEAVEADRGGHIIYLQPAGEVLTDGRWVIASTSMDGRDPHEELLTAEDLSAPDISSDGRWIAFEGRIDGVEGIWRLDLDDGSSGPDLLLEGSEFGCPRWVPDAARVVVAADDGRIEVLDAETGDMDYVAHTGGPSVSCADPVDGHRVVYRVSDGDDRSRLFMTDVESRELREIGSVPEGCIINTPAVSPDGTSVAVDAICEDGTKNGLWLMSLDAEFEPTRITGNGRDADPVDPWQFWAPQWASDGSALVYYRANQPSSGVRMIGIDGAGDSELVGDDACCAVVRPVADD